MRCIASCISSSLKLALGQHTLCSRFERVALCRPPALSRLCHPKSVLACCRDRFVPRFKPSSMVILNARLDRRGNEGAELQLFRSMMSPASLDSVRACEQNKLSVGVLDITTASASKFTPGPQRQSPKMPKKNGWTARLPFGEQPSGNRDRRRGPLDTPSGMSRGHFDFGQ